MGIKEVDVKGVCISVSSPEKAVMECLHLASRNIDLAVCYQVFERAVNLKPGLVSELLPGCKSIKVKRLFLYMVEKARHQWLQFVKITGIDL